MATEIGQRINLKDVDISLEPSTGITADTNAVRGRIAGAEGASITISASDSVAYEGGSYFPAEIVDGKISISGSISKSWITNDFFNALFPIQGEGRFRSVIKPTFTLRGVVANSKSPNRKLTITGVKFNSLNIQNFSLDNYATQNMPFNATGFRFED